MFSLEPLVGIEPTVSILPISCFTTKLQRHTLYTSLNLFILQNSHLKKQNRLATILSKGG